MKVGFYCRIDGRTFGCLLPDEKEKLQTFFAAADNEESEQLQGRKENCEKQAFFCLGLDIRVPQIVKIRQ